MIREYRRHKEMIAQAIARLSPGKIVASTWLLEAAISGESRRMHAPVVSAIFALTYSKYAPGENYLAIRLPYASSRSSCEKTGLGELGRFVGFSG